MVIVHFHSGEAGVSSLSREQPPGRLLFSSGHGITIRADAPADDHLLVSSYGARQYVFSARERATFFECIPRGLRSSRRAGGAAMKEVA